MSWGECDCCGETEQRHPVVLHSIDGHLTWTAWLCPPCWGGQQHREWWQRWKVDLKATGAYYKPQDGST